MRHWAICVTALAAMTSLGLTAQGGVVELVSVAAHGGASAYHSVDSKPSISDDGRFVVFYSDAADLVANDTNAGLDVFLRDLWRQTTICVSVNAAGVPVGGDRGAISGDGRHVVFSSKAGGFVPGIKEGHEARVYAWDRLANTFELISQSTGGKPGFGYSWAAPSRDGMRVAFASYSSDLVTKDVNGKTDIFVRDRIRGTTIRVSEDSNGVGGNDNSHIPAISPDGNWVVFHSKSSNLVWPDRNNSLDVFLYDIANARLSLISRGLGGQDGDGYSGYSSLSDNAAEVYFESYATNLIPHDTNGAADIFAYTRQTGRIERVSEFPDGKEFQLGWNARGKNGHIVFQQVGYPALANGHVPMTLLRRANSKELEPVDAFPWSARGKQAGSTYGDVSADGRTVVFRAVDLTPQDTNQMGDIYVRHFYPRCTAQNDAVVGNVTRFDFEDPGAANQIYVAVTGMDFAPGVHLGGARYLHVAPDELFMASLTTPSLFFRYAGVLDANGKASALFLIPPIPALRGLPTVTACIVFDATRHNGVRGVSNSVPLTVK